MESLKFIGFQERGTPCLILPGSWLRSFGFEAGKNVVIDVTRGRIVITIPDVEGSEGLEVRL